MFENIAKHFSEVYQLKVHERLDEYRLTAIGTGITPDEARSQALQLLSATKGIPIRDDFELQLSFDGDLITITRTDIRPEDKVISHLGSHDGHGEATLDLRVRKSADGVLSVYCLTELGTYLSNEDLSTALAALTSRFQQCLIFESQVPIKEFGSDSIRFVSRASAPQIQCPHRLQTLSCFRDNSNTTNLKSELLPSDFYLTTRSEVPEINEFMDTACAALCAVFLSNSSQLLPQSRLSYKLLGYKTLEGEVTLTNLKAALAALYKIYEWAYSVGGSSDRIGLARNVISLHVDGLEEISDHPGLWNAIHSNYQIYLKANVHAYLEVKGKIAEFLVESTAKTQALVEDLISSLKNSLFAVMTFLLTVVIVNGLKDSGSNVIFSAPYLAVVTILCALLSCWILFISAAIVKRFDKSASITSEVLKLGYGRVLLESEISDSVGPIVKQNRDHLVDQCWLYGKCWMAVAALMIGGFALGTFLNPSSPSNLELSPKAKTITTPAAITQESVKELTSGSSNSNTAQNKVGLELKSPQAPNPGPEVEDSPQRNRQDAAETTKELVKEEPVQKRVRFI